MGRLYANNPVIIGGGMRQCNKQVDRVELQ
ncbi:hypothetical protein ABIE60_000705 [Marinobacterium sp. MBR-109]|jgi:hypothetical protein